MSSLGLHKNSAGKWPHKNLACHMRPTGRRLSITAPNDIHKKNITSMIWCFKMIIVNVRMTVLETTHLPKCYHARIRLTADSPYNRQGGPLMRTRIRRCSQRHSTNLFTGVRRQIKHQDRHECQSDARDD